MLAFKPTMKKAINSPVVANLPVWFTKGPQLPALVRAQISSTTIQMTSIGAHQCSIFLITPRPLMRMKMFTTRNTPKQIHIPGAHWPQAGKSRLSTVFSAEPPIQNWMPHQPAATMPRMMAATLAPRKPKAERQ